MTSLIVAAIQRYYPQWEPPFDNGNTWLKTLCPFHGESVASAAVSYDLEGFNCFACDVRGDAISIIRHEEEVSFAEAKRIAEGLSVGGHYQVSGKPARKSRRRVFGQPGDTDRHNVWAGVRGRATPWT